jgi:divalent metal cation (Fe/Co/Zn/Cd) transporter
MELYPDCGRIITHIEPAGQIEALHVADSDSLSRIESLVEEYLKELDYPCRPHDMVIQDLGGEYSLSFHCSVAPDTKITDAHDLTEKLEHHLRSRVPELRYVSIHVEPEE